jgi:hypothetical protein
MPMPPPTALLPLSARNQLSHAQRWLCGSACTSHVQFSHGLGIETIIERAAAVIEYCKAQNVEIRHAMASVVWRCCMPSHLCPLLRTAAAAWCMVHVVASACCLVHPSHPIVGVCVLDAAPCSTPCVCSAHALCLASQWSADGSVRPQQRLLRTSDSVAKTRFGRTRPTHCASTRRGQPSRSPPSGTARLPARARAAAAL